MKKIIVTGLLVSVLAACAGPRYTGSSYAGSETRRVETIRMGTITALAPVQITDKNSGLGGLAGAAVGGVGAGSAIGRGNGALLAGIAGAALGAVAGDALEGMTNNLNGIRISLKLDDGNHIAVTQEMDAAAQSLKIGDRVQLFNSAGTMRVAK